MASWHLGLHADAAVGVSQRVEFALSDLVELKQWVVGTH